MLSDIIWDQNTLAVAGGAAFLVVSVVAYYWASVEKRRSDNDLKQSMVERGMSVEDIERVLSAKVHEGK